MKKDSKNKAVARIGKSISRAEHPNEHHKEIANQHFSHRIRESAVTGDDYVKPPTSYSALPEGEKKRVNTQLRRLGKRHYRHYAKKYREIRKEQVKSFALENKGK